MEALDDPNRNGRPDVEAPPAAPSRLGRTPLTDPKSVGSSAVFHILLIALASVAVLRSALPSGPPPPRVVQAELGPVDNRAPATTGGGSPGELGGESSPDSLRVSAEGTTATSEAMSNSVAEGLLKDVVPAATGSGKSSRHLTGPSTSGLGLLPGSGSGGGGGKGGGSGGGRGRGIGPGTEFFGPREQGLSFAYVIDCSGSMSEFHALDLAKRELLASLGQLPPDAKFSIIFYNLHTTVFADAAGRPGLMPATAENKERLRTMLTQVQPIGGTDHVVALREAYALKPEVVFFLTDATQLPFEQVRQLAAEAGSIRVHSIEFGIGPQQLAEDPIEELAEQTRGQYRYIDVREIALRKPR